MAQLESQLKTLDENQPQPPRTPRVLYADVNQQVLAVCLANNRASAALITDEGGVMIGSNGMSKENCLGLFAFFNILWDGSPYTRDRLTTESCRLVGRRFTLSIMLQEGVLRKLVEIDSGVSRSTGFLARMLLAQPTSTCGSRPYKEPPADDPAMHAFNDRIAALLDMPLPLDSAADDARLSPPKLGFTPEAKAHWVEYFNEVERRIAKHQVYATIPDFASKSAENVARLAGCFHVFCYGVTGEISLETMQSAIAIAAWHLDETLRIFENIDTPQNISDALLLWDWLQQKGLSSVSLSHLRTHAPSALRKGDRCKKAVELLKERHFLLGEDRKPLQLNPLAMQGVL
jgi:putative DNA primase/helicase